MARTSQIYIYGASGHGLVIADIAQAVGYEKVVFLDDKNEIKFHPNLPKADIVIAIGSNQTRKTVTARVKKAGFNVVSLVHPSAVISPSAVIKSGVVVMPNAVINAGAVIGEGAIINSGAVVEHECMIGKFAHISPNAALAGNVSVGELTHVGIGTSVIQGIIIGKECVIGAGSVVVRDISNKVKAYGVPAKIITKI
ncbi:MULTISPECIES: acetyltransferase [Campylobacter]|uniref:acetyltransferase n=1 Tax=Campylobacter TaxID=194 RepID=UPI001474D7BE|nr:MULTISPECIES: acetyltransferase [unclassified Campylobacter]MBE3022761.1 acetyltransferase [Campylobacter sp. 7477a]MBE3610432.1 acetyltransferase [Campylobacter sp. RM12916]